MGNQKGFSPILFLGLIFILGIAIVSGSFIYKYQYLGRQSEPKTITGKKEVVPAGATPLTGKVLYVSYKGSIAIADPDGKNIVPVSREKIFNNMEGVIPPRIVGISPDSSKILFASYVKYDSNDPNNPDYKIGNQSAYYIYSIASKEIKKIDLTKFTLLGKDPLIVFAGWSADGDKIAFLAIIHQGAGESKTLFGDYDPVTDEVRPIYTTDSPKAGGLMYYDSQKGILVFNSQQLGQSDPTNKAYKIDLRTQKIEEFNKPELLSDIYRVNLSSLYFLSSDTDFSSEQRKKISIYSYDSPNTALVEVTLDDPDPKSNFANNFVWSPNYSYFAIASGYIDQKNGGFEAHRKLNIYTRDGKKVMSRDINNAEFYSGSLFSPDESKFLMVGITSTKADGPKIDVPIWQVIDAKTGGQLSERVISEDLGLHTVKWIK